MVAPARSRPPSCGDIRFERSSDGVRLRDQRVRPGGRRPREHPRLFAGALVVGRLRLELRGHRSARRAGAHPRRDGLPRRAQVDHGLAGRRVARGRHRDRPQPRPRARLGRRRTLVWTFPVPKSSARRRPSRGIAHRRKGGRPGRRRRPQVVTVARERRRGPAPHRDVDPRRGPEVETSAESAAGFASGDRGRARRSSATTGGGSTSTSRTPTSTTSSGSSPTSGT